MNLLKISWSNIKHKPLNTLLSIVLLSFGIGIISMMLLLKNQISEKFDRNIKDIDFVLAAKGSPLQSMLANIYHVDVPTGNIKVTDAAGNTTMQSDYMAPPPAYTLFNAEAATALDIRKRRIELVLSATNLFDVSYRDYMNAFRYFSLDRGRNVAIKIKLTI